MLLLDFIDRQFIHNNPPSPTTSFKGKTVIVTGANVGLGKEACHKLIQLGASLVIIACRSIAKGKAAAKDIQERTSCSAEALQVWKLDLSSYASVIAFADRAKAELPRLDALIANAGLGTRKFRITEDNEETITTNVVSCFLHAFLLFPKLHETAVKWNTQTHLTFTASELYEFAKFKERLAPAGQLFTALNDEKQANMAERYNVSKLLQVLVVKQMAVVAPLATGRVIVNCVAPGMCDTELAREHKGPVVDILLKALGRPGEVGARTLVHGACAGPESHGQYVPDCKITATKGHTSGEEGQQLQDRVWVELREKLEGIKKGVVSDLSL